MIKSSKGTIEIRGTGETVVADFALIVRSLVESGMSKKLIQTINKLALEDEAEVEEEPFDWYPDDEEEDEDELIEKLNKVLGDKNGKRS